MLHNFESRYQWYERDVGARFDGHRGSVPTGTLLEVNECPNEFAGKFELNSLFPSNVH